MGPRESLGRNNDCVTGSEKIRAANARKSMSSDKNEFARHRTATIPIRTINAKDWLICILAKHSVWIGGGVRLILAVVLPYWLDAEQVLPGVAYTDVDYYVFTDAAAYLQQSPARSPYDRVTYRYTPFLAQILAVLPWQRLTSRYLFCIADTVCGWILMQLLQWMRRRKHRERITSFVAEPESSEPNDHRTDHHHNLHVDHSAKQQMSNHQIEWQQLLDACWWLYNPLAINMCTRGSAESLVVLLPVLGTVWMVLIGQDTRPEADPSAQPRSRLARPWIAATIAGLFHGIAMHGKLYPVIYTLSYMAYYAYHYQHPTRSPTSLASPLTRQSPTDSFLAWVLLWIERMLNPIPWVFAGTALITFGLLTYGAVVWYGPVAWQEGFLYHFSRVDHRHNYSMHWYWIYLARARAAASSTVATSTALPQGMAWVGRLLLLPQAILLLVSSLGLAPHGLCLALFVQTLLFVAHNKVITAQYFTWYLCLLPLAAPDLKWTPRLRNALVVTLTSVALWLGSAYTLEMQGLAVHRWVWTASVLFFLAHINLLSALLVSSMASFTSQMLSEPKKLV